MGILRKAMRRAFAAMCLGAALLAGGASAQASVHFNVYFDNTFDEVVSADHLIGTGTFSFDNDLLDGSHLYTTLVNPQILFTLMGETFTQADMSTSAALEVVLYTTPRGRDFYFSAPIGSGAYAGGSVDFLNSNGATLSLEPSGFSPVPFNLYFGFGGSLDSAGNYGATLVPEPASLSIYSLLFALVAARYRRR